MIGSIVHSTDMVTLIGGGVAPEADVLDAVSHAPRLVAADGGAALALRAGQMPEAVIGDFDSLDPATRDAIPQDRLFPIYEQDSTDFDKALRSIRAPIVLAVGFLGARIDHQLAAFNTLVRHPYQVCILIGAEDVTVLMPPRIEVSTLTGDIVSLFPMGPVTGRSEGLQWPIDGLSFAPDARVGTSNRATGPVAIEIDAPNMLLILPRKRLAALIAALSPMPWPEPAPLPARA